MLANWDSPPSAAFCRQKRETMSPESVWKTCLSFVLAGPPMFSLLYFPVKSLICDRTTAFPSVGLRFSCLPRRSPTYDEIPAYIMIFSSVVYLLTGIPRRTKKPRPKWSSREPSRSRLPRPGNGNVVRSMYPTGLFNPDRHFVSI